MKNSEKRFEKRNFLRRRRIRLAIRRDKIPKENRRRAIEVKADERIGDIRGAFAFSSRSNDAKREKSRRDDDNDDDDDEERTKKRFFVARRETGLPGRLPPGFLRAPIRFEAEHTRPPVQPGRKRPNFCHRHESSTQRCFSFFFFSYFKFEHVSFIALEISEKVHFLRVSSTFYESFFLEFYSFGF